MNVTKRPGIHNQRIYNEGYSLSTKNSTKTRTNEEMDAMKTDDECSDCEELLENEENALDSSDDEHSPHKSVKSKLPKVGDSVKRNQTDQDSAKYLYLSIFLVIILISLVSCFILKHENKNVDCSQIPSCNFKKHYKQLQQEFQKQNMWSWKVIRSAISSIVDSTQHDHPAVILLMASEKAGAISSCLANRLAYSIEESFNNQKGYVRLNPIKGITDLEMKEQIDTAFRESFENNNHHVILLERLDMLSAESAMMLHSYCDHENAPYKHAVVLMTATSNASVESSELSTKKMDWIAWKHLDAAWDTLDEEKRVALLSRITTSVALILPEDDVPPTCTEYSTH